MPLCTCTVYTPKPSGKAQFHYNRLNISVWRPLFTNDLCPYKIHLVHSNCELYLHANRNYMSHQSDSQWQNYKLNAIILCCSENIHSCCSSVWFGLFWLENNFMHFSITFSFFFALSSSVYCVFHMSCYLMWNGTKCETNENSMAKPQTLWIATNIERFLHAWAFQVCVYVFVFVSL